MVTQQRPSQQKNHEERCERRTHCREVRKRARNRMHRRGRQAQTFERPSLSFIFKRREACNLWIESWTSCGWGAGGMDGWGTGSSTGRAPAAGRVAAPAAALAAPILILLAWEIDVRAQAGARGTGGGTSQLCVCACSQACGVHGALAGASRSSRELVTRVPPTRTFVFAHFAQPQPSGARVRRLARCQVRHKDGRMNLPRQTMEHLSRHEASATALCVCGEWSDHCVRTGSAAEGRLQRRGRSCRTRGKGRGGAGGEREAGGEGDVLEQHGHQ